MTAAEADNLLILEATLVSISVSLSDAAKLCESLPVLPLRALERITLASLQVRRALYHAGPAVEQAAGPVEECELSPAPF